MWTLALADDDILKVITLGIAGVVAVVWIIASSIRAALVGRAKEATRREIAAYIAEGSMTPEQGEKLLSAGTEEGSCKND
ncbi:MAG: hypothetical protein K2Y21_11560 [Phycisphaerales bacterium]|nr:hypothetical protein [Phycisphaerales bacterium]